MRKEAQACTSEHASIKKALRAKNVELAEYRRPAEPLLMRADPTRLQQILWNLLSNAVKFTETGGRVRADASQHHGQVVITVTDTDCGISTEFLPHVFDRFSQADNSNTRRKGGLGLGLALVRHLAELHGGTVEASSGGLGCGSTLVVRLPAVGQSARLRVS